ncbi:hypothetical protein, partial [Photobacterium gaetbulicola]|uniref:hypothetical protein n=1 Tax=Photobacterium gaetbulicola TaxID=1295392 RepID=UPI001E40E1DF
RHARRTNKKKHSLAVLLLFLLIQEFSFNIPRYIPNLCFKYYLSKLGTVGSSLTQAYHTLLY